MVKAFFLGLLASFFFALTFILNKQMNLEGGSYMWTASLRYIFMFMMLLSIMIVKNEFITVLNIIKKNPFLWLIWSTIGFGFFYLPLCYASAYGSPWLVASSWQVTIVAGALMTPLISPYEEGNPHARTRNPVPIKNLIISLIILLGIVLIQYNEAKHSAMNHSFLVMIPVLIAAFSYPLGNRKTIELNNKRLNTTQRIFAMTLCSLPFWMILSIYAYTSHGLPSTTQLYQSFFVAFFSGLIATILFFKATDLVCHSPKNLAIIESTQAGEVIFTLIISLIVFKSSMPSFISLIGIAIVISGMIVNSLVSDP